MTDDQSRAGPSSIPATEYLAFDFNDYDRDEAGAQPNGPVSPNGKGKEKATSRESELKGTPWADLVRWDDCRDATEM